MRVDRKHPRPGTLGERQRATARVIEKYRRRPFAWEGANCWKLTAAQARAMGHPFPPVPQFRSALGARRALSRAGCASAAEFLDRHFQRLPTAAFAMVGDLVLLPGDPDGKEAVLDAVTIADGHGNLFGWHDGAPGGLTAIKFAAGAAIGAWRL